MNNLHDALTKLAQEKPELRADLVPLLKEARGETFHRLLSGIQTSFLDAILREVSRLLRDEGFQQIKVRANTLSAMRNGEQFALYALWHEGIYLSGKVALGRKKREINKYPVTSVSAAQVAAQLVFSHFWGVVD